MLTFPVGYFSNNGGGGGASYLDGVEASTCCDLDATISASYGGSGQTWANLIASPADSASQTDYDFYLGADVSSSTDDPIFTGSAGNSAAYFLHDGGDFFKLVSSANPSLFKNMHKTTGGSDFWLAMAFRFIQNDATQVPFGTSEGTVLPHIRIQTTALEKLQLLQRGDSSQKSIIGPTLTDGTDSLFIISHSHSGNDTRFWLNSTTATNGAHTFNTTTTDASDPAAISARSDGTTAFPNTTRLYGFYAGNEYLDNTKAGNIFAHLETRHNRNYTP